MGSKYRSRSQLESRNGPDTRDEGLDKSGAGGGVGRVRSEERPNALFRGDHEAVSGGRAAESSVQGPGGH